MNDDALSPNPKKDRHTGLGSFLFQRTTPRQEEKTPERKPVQETPIQESTSFPKESVDSSPNIKKPPKPIRDRCTIYLEPEVNQQLELVARIERRQRSEVVAEILRRHLPRYSIKREED